MIGHPALTTINLL